MAHWYNPSATTKMCPGFQISGVQLEHLLALLSCFKPKKTRGVSHCDLAIYNKKYLKAKEELWKF
jgi:hypothetical protein